MANQKYDPSKDYFAVLGIHKHSDEATIKRAYRKMARRYHPDVSKIHNAKEKFQEISEAYEILRKHKQDYARDFQLRSTSKPFSSARSQTNDQGDSTKGSGFYTNQSRKTYSHSAHTPVHGKNREITYPLTLRYAIRLLKIGYFYIPGLKIRMKFTREALFGKTFRIKGKGYQGLFGGDPGDYLVRFELKNDALKWELRGADIYGTIRVPSVLLEGGSALEVDSPSGTMTLTIPSGYNATDYIKVSRMGLPQDAYHSAGDLFARLEVA